jgi:hypothetical protein
MLASGPSKSGGKAGPTSLLNSWRHAASVVTAIHRSPRGASAAGTRNEVVVFTDQARLARRVPRLVPIGVV